MFYDDTNIYVLMLNATFPECGLLREDNSEDKGALSSFTISENMKATI